MKEKKPEISQSTHRRAPDEVPYPDSPYSWYVVGVLTVFYTLSFVDRQIIALLVEPMKADLGLTDVQMSLLGGVSFALFYTLFGIPMGRMADSRNRRGLIAAGVALWSLTTALCGFAGRFWHLLILRMGVGVGESTLSPAAFSLISDYFPAERRATALSVYSMGIYFGSGLAFTGGAMLLDWATRFVEAQEGAPIFFLGTVRPWQIVFLAVGVPGLILSSLLWTVREPKRRGLAGAGARPSERPSPARIESVPLTEVLVYFRENWKIVLCHNLGIAFLSMASYSGGFWDVAFFRRTHGWVPQESGIWYGLCTIAAGAFGVYFGGRLAGYLYQKGFHSANMLTILISAVGWLPFGIAYPLMPTASLSMLMLFPTLFTAAMPFGCAAAAIQAIMPPQMRGQASAVYLFMINIIGLGMGPTAVALLTERMFADLEMLKFSLVIIGSGAHMIAAGFLFFSLRPYLSSVERARSWRPRERQDHILCSHRSAERP